MVGKGQKPHTNGPEGTCLTRLRTSAGICHRPGGISSLSKRSSFHVSRQPRMPGARAVRRRSRLFLLVLCRVHQSAAERLQAAAVPAEHGWPQCRLPSGSLIPEGSPGGHRARNERGSNCVFRGQGRGGDRPTQGRGACAGRVSRLFCRPARAEEGWLASL
jgi:hypothetical protein